MSLVCLGCLLCLSGVTADPRAQSRLQLSHKDVSGSDGPTKHGEGYKVRSHFGSSLEMALCLLNDSTFRQLATGAQKVLQASRDFHGRQNKQNRSSSESLALMSSLACGQANEELRHISSVLDTVDFYEHAGAATSLPHLPGATVDHPLVAESEETTNWCLVSVGPWDQEPCPFFFFFRIT